MSVGRHAMTTEATRWVGCTAAAGCHIRCRGAAPFGNAAPVGFGLCSQQPPYTLPFFCHVGI